jgi:hypothetical protein
LYAGKARCLSKGEGEMTYGLSFVTRLERDKENALAYSASSTVAKKEVS